jgi:hypothetical protein
MPKPKKRKRKIKLSQRARVRKKNEEKNDTMPQMPIKKIVPDNGATFKIKLRRKQ